MRLLECNNPGNFTLTRNFVGDDVPPYAILSHTWGADSEEVHLKDFMNGEGVDKPGYNKIRCCGEQAKRDGLRYFWMDNCCIDKTSSAELSEDINSMLQWYRKAQVCYVYLADVKKMELDAVSARRRRYIWPQQAVYARRTLQELIASSDCTVFSKDREPLGKKNDADMSKKLSVITGIDDDVLADCQMLSRTSIA